MRKFLLSAALGLAFLMGSNRARVAGSSTSTPALAATEDSGPVLAREQYFGPYTQAVANQKAGAWTAAGYRCSVVRYPSGWYVKVIFQN